MVSEHWLVTFIAQIINFLVLVWLLQRFLYAPIVTAMKERQARIAAQQEDVERAQREAEQEAEQYRRKNAELEHAREELLATAGREVDEWKQEHLQRARAEVDGVQHEWYRAIQRERSLFLQEIRRRAGQQVYKMVRHVLSHLADVDLERQVVASFLLRLQHVSDDEKAEIAAAICNPAQQARPAGSDGCRTRHKAAVESAFEIPEEDQERIRTEIRQHLTDGVEIEFKVEPSLICGIELRAAGYKIAWSAAETLEELEEHFSQELEEALALAPAE